MRPAMTWEHTAALTEAVYDRATRMIRVTANLAWLVPGRVGGSEEYTVRLLSAVIDAAPADIELRRDRFPGAVLGPSRCSPRSNACCSAGRCTSGRGGSQSSRRPSTAHTRGADVVHHFGGRVPARHHGRDVVTIHDLQPLAAAGELLVDQTALPRRGAAPVGDGRLDSL